MCVIIFVPKESTISIDEIKKAWNTNPDGAGFSIQKDGKVIFKRGFMRLNDYIKAISPLIGKYNLLLHFRISTSSSINRVQTHPYKKGDVTLTEGSTKRPVICMNGIISGQKEYQSCNDTMSYIVDHESAFSRINQDILNIIESDTGAKWAVMKPDEVLLSSKFVSYEGRFYSNKNHLYKTYYRSYSAPTTLYKSKPKNSFKKTFPKKLQNQIKKDAELFEDVEDFIDLWCNNDSDLCTMCTQCLKNARTINDVKITLNENYYYCEAYELDEEDSYEPDTCCGVSRDIWEDFYYYGNY